MNGLRSYINACYRGEGVCEALTPFREESQSKFVILAIEPALIGGTYILFSFLDAADKVFSTTVYSFVDEEEEKINLGYLRFKRQIHKFVNAFREQRIRTQFLPLQKIK